MERIKNIFVYQGDLPKDVKLKKSVAVDCEMTGLDPKKDKLCVVQLSNGDGKAYVVQVKAPYKCPNLKKLFKDEKIEKIFQYARLDMTFIKNYLGVTMNNVVCTKIMSKIARPKAKKHSLKVLVKEIVGIDLSKEEQISNWAKKELSDSQVQYAANDVLYLHKVKKELVKRVKKLKMMKVAQKCFEFLQYRSDLDNYGLGENDIFSHE